ncbi:phosphatidylglycerol--prolipoprotein diacylglyceryl transferase [Gammaproteobacteria bacterium]
MFNYPDIDPIALALGPFRIHWYGLMYLMGFLSAWILGQRRAAHIADWNNAQVEDLIFHGALGVILGGRLGYMFFYQFPSWSNDPWALFRVWEGGMSFHGGLLGVLVATALFCRKHRKAFFDAADFVAPLVPLGLAAGRLGNFINGELWGSFTRAAWGVRLPCGRFPAYCQGLPEGAAWSLPVHPSQLYEMCLEGGLLFVLLWWFSARTPPRRAVSGLFLLGYGLFRFSVEIVRLPDPQLGYLAMGWVTMGQVLSLPMILAGMALLGMAYRSVRRESSAKRTTTQPVLP